MRKLQMTVERPNPNANTQLGIPLDPAMHKVAPQIATGDRRGESVTVADAEQGQRVAHLVHPTEPLPTQMVSPAQGSNPEAPIGDVLVTPKGAARASVWEAAEGEGLRPTYDEAEARKAATARAATDTDIGHADEQDNLGGGPGGR